MIRTVLQLSWWNLRRDPVALGLTFVVPLVFFSIFALVFGAIDKAGIEPVTTVLVVERPGDEVALRFAELVGEEGALEVLGVETGRIHTGHPALERLRRGEVAAVVVLRDGFGEALAATPVEALRSARRPAVDLRLDGADPAAGEIVAAVLQGSALRLAAETWSAGLAGAGLTRSGGSENPFTAGLLEIATIEGARAGGGRSPVSFFAAGIAVMFLLFAVSGRSAILIEEREGGLLPRLLTTRLTLGGLLFGRWLFLALLGSIQVTIMFVWGSIAFGLDLWSPSHLAGFVVMTATSAAAAAAFGLMLSTACRTRAQLNGVSVVLVLVMSAVGGSMFPRFLMPDTLEKMGLLTFNAWALDGYQKVLWYDARVIELWPQVGALLLMTLVFSTFAGALARRWRTD